MRARLGESMASIQKLSTPYTNVTTTSLQAFHAFSLGEEEHRMGRDFPQASSFYQEAMRLDPSFAMAYARLGVAYGNQGAATKAMEYLKKAYDLRERVTERERMYIESQYALQQYDLPKSLQSYKLFVATYPRDAAAWNNLAKPTGCGGLWSRPCGLQEDLGNCQVEQCCRQQCSRYADWRWTVCRKPSAT